MFWGLICRFRFRFLHCLGLCILSFLFRLFCCLRRIRWYCRLLLSGDTRDSLLIDSWLSATLSLFVTLIDTWWLVLLRLCTLARFLTWTFCRLSALAQLLNSEKLLVLILGTPVVPLNDQVESSQRSAENYWEVEETAKGDDDDERPREVEAIWRVQGFTERGEQQSLVRRYCNNKLVEELVVVFI